MDAGVGRSVLFGGRSGVSTITEEEMSRGRGRFVLGVCLKGLRCRGSGTNAAVLETDFGRGAAHVQALRVCR